MNSRISMLNKLVAATVMALFLVACGGGGGGGSGGGSGSGTSSSGGTGSGGPVAASSTLTLRLTDAKVNSLEAVWVTFTEVTFQPADGRDRFTHVFDEPITVDLTLLAGGGEVMLLEEYPLEPGDYEWMRLAVLSGEENVDKTYVVEDLSEGGGTFPLKCPSCAKEQSGLKLKWPRDTSWETEGWVDFTVDFDVRQSITLAKPNAGLDKKYILKPVLQILTTELASTYIHGMVIDAGLLDPTRREDCVVYVFAGESSTVTPDDYCSEDFGVGICDTERGDIALTTATVDFDVATGDYLYRTMFLYPGTYTVALTCEDDEPGIEENPTFIGKTSFFADTVANGAGHDFRLADIELTLTKELTVDDSPYEEGEEIGYSYMVSNDSDNLLTPDGVVGPVVVLDDKTDVTCDDVNSAGNGDDNLDPGEVVNCLSSYMVTRPDAQAGSVTNTATASMGSTSSNTVMLTVDTITTPALVLTKSGMLDDTFAAGETISYSFEATNNGNVDLTTVEISDALPGLSALSCTPIQPVALLAIDATINCDASYTITAADVNTTGSVSNMASATSIETGPVDSNMVELPAP
jgi:uncharacterized repeat protein (TIGR01451 family)